MRTRLFIISSLAVAAVLGASSVNAAEAKPNGPGNLSPTPTTQPQPCCNDKIAPKPTTTTVPKAPGDIAPAPKDEDPKPNGPGDFGQAPKDDGGVEPGPDTTGNGSGSDNVVPTADNDGNEPVVASDFDDTATPDADASVDAATEATETTSDGMSPFVIALIAAVAGGLIALLATRRRRDDETADRV
jgi:hypothetical protein